MELIKFKEPAEAQNPGDTLSAATIKVTNWSSLSYKGALVAVSLTPRLWNEEWSNRRELGYQLNMKWAEQIQANLRRDKAIKGCQFLPKK